MRDGLMIFNQTPIKSEDQAIPIVLASIAQPTVPQVDL
jgi:hypothetical protein